MSPKFEMDTKYGEPFGKTAIFDEKGHELGYCWIKAKQTVRDVSIFDNSDDNHDI